MSRFLASHYYILLIILSNLPQTVKNDCLWQNIRGYILPQVVFFISLWQIIGNYEYYYR